MQILPVCRNRHLRTAAQKSAPSDIAATCARQHFLSVHLTSTTCDKHFLVARLRVENEYAGEFGGVHGNISVEQMGRSHIFQIGCHLTTIGRVAGHVHVLCRRQLAQACNRFKRKARSDFVSASSNDLRNSSAAAFRLPDRIWNSPSTA